jgi:hypothetical protein
VAAVVGVPAARAWGGLGLESRDAIAGRPAMLASVEPARVAWSDPRPHPYADAPPDTGARFGFAYLPGRDRARDPELTTLWRRSSGAAERLLDLLGIQLVLVPESVAIPAGMLVHGTTASGGWVLAENQQRRARAFVAPRWSWVADEATALRTLFPDTPGERAPLSMSEVRLLGGGPAAPPRSGRPVPSPACAIASPFAEEVALDCLAGQAGYVVLLDRFAPGWSAEVDGQPARIERADLVARAVAVARGRHHLVFRYRAPGLRAGAALSLGGWLAALALAIALRRRQGRSAVPIDPG